MLLTFLWSCQKSGPYKMYMALRTFQKKIMSPNPGNNSNALSKERKDTKVNFTKYCFCHSKLNELPRFVTYVSNFTKKLSKIAIGGSTFVSRKIHYFCQNSKILDEATLIF